MTNPIHGLIDELKADLQKAVIFSEETWSKIEALFESKKQDAATGDAPQQADLPLDSPDPAENQQESGPAA